MRKFIFILCAFSSISFVVLAQKSAQDSYHDFTVYRTTKGNEADITKTKALLTLQGQLTAKQLTNVQYHLGRMYEEIGEAESAIPYYEKSLKGEPNYFVIHRALGFIYLNKTKPFVKQMNDASAAKNVTANATSFTQYKAMVQKALPYLEKYQACEPDDDTLNIITNLYKSIKEPQAIAALPDRLKPLSEKCVSLLDDE